jgi:outer membrane protein TolC
VVQKILLGEKAESIPVAFSDESRLSINMATARSIGVSPPWELLNEADLVQERREDVTRRVTLAGVVREAVDVNLDVAAGLRTVTAGREDVRGARANLLPHLKGSATALWIDEDRAAASFGQTAERMAMGALTVRQVLFSEPAWASWGIERRLQEGREGSFQALRLGIARDAALAYLNVLIASTRERIQKSNLRLTRENLDLARVRAAVGSAGPSEVYRWESELARRRSDVIAANAARNLAEIDLNRILHRPLEEHFLPEEAEIEDEALLLKTAPPYRYITNRKNFKLLREYLTERAMTTSPELAALDAAIAAQERLLASRSRRYYAPTIALEGKVENIFDRGGAGSEGGVDAAGVPEDFSWMGDLFPETPDDLNWQVGVSATLPLFEGGSRCAAHAKAREDLARLRRERDSATEKIEQRLRSALHLSGSSFASIRLSREAADAAEKSLEVVQDSYGRGAASILDLLDSQNAALAAEEAAAIATYRFLADYMEVQRAVGQFDIFLGDEEKASLIEDLERYILENGGSLPDR